MADMEKFYEDLIIIKLYVQAGPSKMPCLKLQVEPYMTLLIEQTIANLVKITFVSMYIEY